VALTILMWSSLYVKMVNKRKVFKIFYSSETGTAKKYAREALDLLSISFRTEMCALNEVEATFDTLGESDVAIVIVSTFGNGEPPEMSRGYMKRMNSVMEMFQAGDPKVRKMYQDIGIEKKHFAVFGLGSTAYPKFAAFGKTLDNIYETVGATRMLPLSTGDELKDQRGSFNKWLRKLFLVSLKVMEVEAPKSYLEKMTAVKQHKWRLSVKDRKRDVNDALSDLSGFPVHDFTITKRSQLHPEKDEPATIKVDFEFSSDDVSYDPGDHLTIYPMNDKEKVEFLKSRLNNNPPDNRLVSLLVDNGGLWEQVDDFPTEVYFSDLLCYFIDVNQVPSQALLGLLARYTEDKQEKESLTVLANDDEIYDKWREDAKDICSTLQEFVSVNINSALLVSQLSLIKPRRYSIASAPRGQTLSLVVGVVRYQTPTGRPKAGLASAMLETVPVGSNIPGYIKYAKEMHFTLPEDPAWPIIMIAAGSGIAPFRGFWMKRWEQQLEGHTVGKTQLYFGCRKKSMNLLKNETDSVSIANQSFLKRMQCSDIGAIDFQREVAYSRESAHPKQYVQNLITRDAVKIYDIWINKGGYIYICGKIKMAEDVENTLLEILKHIGNMDKDAAIEKFADMRKNFRYQEDIFG